MDIINKKEAKSLIGGFTLIELIIAICIMAILMAIAIPSFVQWRQSVQYKQAADGILSAMRTAKNNAVTLNMQNRVECNPTANRYRITQGNKSYNSDTWTTVKQDWITLPSEVFIKTGDSAGTSDLTIQFSPNGTASDRTVCVNSSASTQYKIIVTSSGRIRNVKQ